MKTYKPEGWLYESGKGAVGASPSALYDAMNRGEILEAKAVMCDFDHNLIVDLGGVKGVIPRLGGTIGIESGRVKDIALISRVGKPVAFIIEQIKVDENGKLLCILSRKAAQERCVENYISRLTPGDIIDARVTHLEAFGAFCDIGCGIIALLPIDSISVSRITHPSDRFRPGEDIKVVVRSIDSNGRITLSSKELLGTWEQNAAMFSQGQTVSGKVRSVEEYGIFVELAPNLAGLAEARKNVKVGQTASVYIKSLIPEKMKVKLIIIDSFDSGDEISSDYFIDSGHIDYWKYSPDVCRKLVETDFSALANNSII